MRRRDMSSSTSMVFSLSREMSIWLFTPLKF